MTSTTTTTQPSASRGTVAGLGATSLLLALAGTALGAHGWTELLVVGAVLIVTTAVVFGIVVPRALRRVSAAGTALALSIPALLLLVPAFWTGLPLVLGVAGALVGNAGRRAPSGTGACIAAVVLGALAAVGYVASYVSDSLSGGTGFLFS